MSEKKFGISKIYNYDDNNKWRYTKEYLKRVFDNYLENAFSGTLPNDMTIEEFVEKYKQSQ